MTAMGLSVPNESEAPLDAMAWYAWESEQAESGWLLTYVDVLSVILAILVLLLGHLSVQQVEPAYFESDAVAQEPVIEVPDIPTPQAMPEPLAPHAAEPEDAQLAAPPIEAEPEPIHVEAVAEEPPPVVVDRVESAESQALPEPQLEPEPAPAAPAPAEVSPEARLIDAIENRFQNEVRVVKQARGLSLEIAEVILFDSGKAQLRPEAESVLGRVASILIEIGEANIAVEGHTDNRPIHGGQFDSNWDLAAARANRVTRFLLDHGLAAERLRSISYGDAQPVADNSTDAGRAANRRVNLRIEFL